jgi:cytochrome c
MDSIMPPASVRMGGDEVGAPAFFGSTESHALGQADRLAALGQLAGGLAHEMNTPLGSISALAEESLELIQDRRLSAKHLAELRGHLLAIMRQSYRCSRIANRLLQFAQPRHVGGERGDFGQVVPDVIDLLTPSARAQHVVLECDLALALPVVPIGPAELEQLLHNLVQNGIDACHGGGVVRIKVRAGDGRILLVVEDTGCGIADEHLERIFDPFFTTKPVGQGTGLGLSVCHGIVAGAGGSIEVASAPGSGTRVIVWLPNAPSSRPPGRVGRVRAGEGEPRRGTLGSQRVLHDSSRRSPVVPAALLVLSIALLAAPGCLTAGPSEQPAASDGQREAKAQAQAQARSAAGLEARPAVDVEMSGATLYTHYCAACHGENGDGEGPAARFLYPKPRNFRDGHFRLVTATNMVPNDQDLMRTLERGMPGSAMFPFGHLSESDRQELVAQVRLRVRQGIEDRLRREAAEIGEKVDPAELADTLKRLAEPGLRIEIPRDLPPQGAESVSRGLAIYLKRCASCHGETGKGDGVQEQKDEAGMPIRPRDFTRGIFKGGRNRDQLYARVMLGAPGTPMPSSSASLKPDETGDLINFILSLSDSSTPDRVEHHRKRFLTWWMASPFSEEIPESLWNHVDPAPVVVSPLWWRNYDDPDLLVQAIHDGETLAIRLSWRDDTPNTQAVRPQDFPDMAAVQFFKGEREPFLGMGAAGSPVDVWLWNAAAQADLVRYADVDTAYPNMAVDLYPYETRVEGPRAHPTQSQPRDFLAAWAAGNQRSDPTHVSPGAHLHAQGFGSLTMRPRTSQAVSARGHREGNRWVVVLQRPLGVRSGEGLTINRGDRVSVAFALWDGAARDRNGQKLVSIWHDLVLE